MWFSGIDSFAWQSLLYSEVTSPRDMEIPSRETSAAKSPSVESPSRMTREGRVRDHFMIQMQPWSPESR